MHQQNGEKIKSFQVNDLKRSVYLKKAHEEIARRFRVPHDKTAKHKYL